MFEPIQSPSPLVGEGEDEGLIKKTSFLLDSFLHGFHDKFACLFKRAH
jgi:hypothetical protein